MKTVKKTPEQIKGAIRNMAQEKSIRAQDILQVYFLKGFLSDCHSRRTKICSYLKEGF